MTQVGAARLRCDRVLRRLSFVFAVVLAVTAVVGWSALRGAPASAAGLSVRVAGNQLVDGGGQPIRLLGVDRSGTEYACAQGWGIFDGPSDDASVAAIAAWHVNAVRVPLNEDCWLGINGVNPAYSGTAYRDAIVAYVGRLNAAGLIAVLDLHWNGPGTSLAGGQQVMADADHSPAFWQSVGATFKTNPAVVFDLYNEPHDISWSCWRDGCATGAGWQAAGMQSLLNALRSSGATQPALAGGLNWAGDLSQWLTWRPSDPAGQLAASVHIYNFSQCNTAACWSGQIAPVAAQVPVVTGELGENDCGEGFVDTYMNWADAAGVGYLGWNWDTASCGAGPALISAYDGTPTPFGAGLRSHLNSLASGTSAPVPVVSRPLSLDSVAVTAGGTIHATATLANPSTSAVNLQTIAIAGRPPGGTNSGGPFDDFTSTGPVTIPAGGSYVVAGSRSFTASDPAGTWYSYLTWQDAAGAWHDQVPTVTFQVGTSGPTTTTTTTAVAATTTTTVATTTTTTQPVATTTTTTVTPTTTTTLAPTSGGIPVSVSGAPDAGSNAWWAADNLKVVLSGRVASLRIDLRVLRSPGLSYSGMWSSLPAGASLTHVDTAGAVDYIFSVAPAGGLASGTYTLSGAFGLTGVLHSIGSDTWTATTTGPSGTSTGSA